MCVSSVWVIIYWLLFILNLNKIETTGDISSVFGHISLVSAHYFTWCSIALFGALDYVSVICEIERTTIQPLWKLTLFLLNKCIFYQSWHCNHPQLKAIVLFLKKHGFIRRPRKSKGWTSEEWNIDKFIARFLRRSYFKVTIWNICAWVVNKWILLLTDWLTCSNHINRILFKKITNTFF